MLIAPQASSAAGNVDSVFLFILALSVVFLAFITGAMIYFAIKYNRKRRPKGEDIEGNLWLEIVWTAVPTVLFLAMFLYGWTNFSYMREVPRDAMVIDVTGRQWAWSFKYPNGKVTTDLLLAVDRPVKLQLHSTDVIHGFFIPAFRIKQDAVPGKENYTWFMPTQLGSFDIECTVICGVSHALMLSKAIVVSVPEFEEWFSASGDAPMPGKVSGQIAVTDAAPKTAAEDVLRRHMCFSCHSADGSPMVGPTLKGLYGTRKTVVDAKGKEGELLVDEAYLADSITKPMESIAKGYPPAMPPNSMTADEVKEVVDFIKALK